MQLVYKPHVLLRCGTQVPTFSCSISDSQALFFPLPQCSCGFTNGSWGAGSPIFLSHFPSPLFSFPPSCLRSSFSFSFNLGLGLAGPYPRVHPRVHFAPTATQAPSQGRGRIKSEFANVVKPRAGVLTTDSNAVPSKYCSGADLIRPLPDLVRSRASSPSTNDAASRSSRSFVSK